MFNRSLLILFSLSTIIFGKWENGNVIRYAHSHNDYLNRSPLLSALEHGFKSIEVDIILYKGKLYVGHDWWQIKKDNVIEKLYLNPLWNIFLDNGGHIYENDDPLYLLVDIKTSAKETYPVLEKILNNYKPMLSRVVSDALVCGSVKIILSGNKPELRRIEDIEERLVFIDGRLSDIGKNISNKIIPMISADWSDNFKWKGRGQFPDTELSRLNELVQKVHLEKKELRFWGSPDNRAGWQIMHSTGVDLINTDKISEYSDYSDKYKE